MLKSKLTILFSVIFLAFSFLVLQGCDKKADKTPSEEMTETQSDEQTVPEQTAPDEMEEEQPQIPDLTGTWTGTFDSRSATLRITKQEGEEIGGSISVAYRNTLNKTFTGQVHTDTRKVNLDDSGTGRFNGTYAADLSEDGRKLTGTFTMDLDGKKYSFSFSK